MSLPLLQRYRPAAVWLFAPRTISNLVEWTQKTREVTENATKIWVQVGGIEEAVNVCRACKPDVLVVQGIDAGGHGLNHGAGVISLLPEVSDALYGLVKLGELAEMPILIAASGIAEGRGHSLLDIGSGRRCDGH